MKNDFISVASHELKTPLTAIKSYALMMEKDLEPALSEKIQKRMSVIKLSISRLETLVADLLNVSKIEQNKVDFAPSSIDTNLMIGEIVAQLEPTAVQKNLKLIFVPESGLPHIQVNADRLREVLINLIGNAIKYIGLIDKVRELVEREAFLRDKRKKISLKEEILTEKLSKVEKIKSELNEV